MVAAAVIGMSARRSNALSGEHKPGVMERQHQQVMAGKRVKPSFWRRWLGCGPVKFFALIVAVPLVLNYAALKREADALRPPGAAPSNREVTVVMFSCRRPC